MNVVIINAPAGKTYFARIGDELFDAVVKEIRLDTVTFALNSPSQDSLSTGRLCERFVLRQENEKMRVDSRKFLSVGVLLLISTLAVNGATARENAAVKDVSFNPVGDSLEVKITTTPEAKFTYFELNEPHRLVIDFHGIQNDIGFKEKQIAIAGVDPCPDGVLREQGPQSHENRVSICTRMPRTACWMTVPALFALCSAPRLEHR